MKILVNNKKTFFNYEILEKFEAGISLLGCEVKALITSRSSFNIAIKILILNKILQEHENYYWIKMKLEKLICFWKNIVQQLYRWRHISTIKK